MSSQGRPEVGVDSRFAILITLLAEHRGVATVCFYCGAQNLIREKMEVDLAAAKRLDQ